MRHFTINLVVNIIGAILFLVMGIALIVGFVLNQSIVEELQQVTLLVLIMLVIDILLLPLIFLIHLMISCRRRTLTTGTPSSFVLASWHSSLLASSPSALGRWSST